MLIVDELQIAQRHNQLRDSRYNSLIKETRTSQIGLIWDWVHDHAVRAEPGL